jgi:hypothetical protein
MAKREEQSRSTIIRAAEIVGQAAGAVDAFRSRHPHPISEVGDALTAGQQALKDLAAQARVGSAAAVAKTMDAAERAQAIVRQTGSRALKTVARMKPATKPVATRAKKAGRKRAQTAAPEQRTSQTKKTATAPGSRKKRSAKAKSAKVARPSAAATRRLESSHVKRSQAHTASRGRRKQARRDKRR